MGNHTSSVTHHHYNNMQGIQRCMMHQCGSCPGRAGLKPFLNEQLKDVY